MEVQYTKEFFAEQGKIGNAIRVKKFGKKRVKQLCSDGGKKGAIVRKAKSAKRNPAKAGKGKIK